MSSAKRAYLSRELYPLPPNFPSSAFSQDNQVIGQIGPCISAALLYRHQDLSLWLKTSEKTLSDHLELPYRELESVLNKLWMRSYEEGFLYVTLNSQWLLLLSVLSLGASAESHNDQSLQLLVPVLYNLSEWSNATPNIDVLMACIITIQVLEIMCALGVKGKMVRISVNLLQKMMGSGENPFGSCRRKIEIVEARLMAFEIGLPGPVFMAPASFSSKHSSADQALFQMYRLQHSIRSGGSSDTGPLQSHLDFVELNMPHQDGTVSLLRQEAAWARIWLEADEIDISMRGKTFSEPFVKQLCHFIERMDILNFTLINDLLAITRKLVCLQVLWLMCSKHPSLRDRLKSSFIHVRKTLCYRMNIITLKKLYEDLKNMAALILQEELPDLESEVPGFVRSENPNLLQ